MPRILPSQSLRILALLLFGVSGAVHAQNLNPFGEVEAPFSEESDILSLNSRFDAFWLQKSAQRALEAGQYSVSFEFSKQALALWGDDPAAVETEISAIDALLALENWIEATARIQALEEADAPIAAQLSLRRAMISFAEDSVEKVEADLAGVTFEELPLRDRPWIRFLRGWLVQRKGGRDFQKSYDEARRLAAESSPALASQIGYLIFKSSLASRTVGAETIAQLQNAVLENQGREIGYSFAQQLAVSLYDAGEVEGAIRLINEQLLTIPPELRLVRAQFQLLQSMSAGLARVEGRQAFRELLAGNEFPELMSIALQQAFSDARSSNGRGLEVILETLNQMIPNRELSVNMRAEHVLLDQALYYRAVFRFLDKDYLGAEDDSDRLQVRFPLSPYRRGMLALQASSAWNRERFRTAASHLQQLRTSFSDLENNATLSALVGDCYLRAGLRSNTLEDFRNAADSYAVALSNVNVAGQGGPIFFQLVLARIRSGQVDTALEVLDDPYLRGLAGNEMIWRSEWTVMNEMRRLGRMADAYDRVEVIVARPVSDPLLRLRLLWLAVKLSIDSSQPEDTEYWVEQVNEFIAANREDIGDPELIAKVEGSCLLSLADSIFILDNADEAVALLERLRVDYADYEAAVFSYIYQARYYSNINRTVEAQQLLVSLADEYANHRLAPVALFEAAGNAERRGEDAYLDQANKLLERIATDYPKSDIVFYARLKQADLLRKLNKFGSAERIYEFLEDEYSSRPDRYLAQLSLADTLLAQSNENPAKFEAAVSRLELLMDLPEAPLGLRVEAGYKLAQAWRVRGERLKAKEILWLFYDLTIVEELRIRVLTRKGRYWLARCMFALAEISREEGNWDKANEFYQEIVEYGLQGSALARARLEALQPPVSN